MKATFSKLKSGNWGVRVVTDDPFEELPESGATVKVVLRSGEETEAKITKLVWSGSDQNSDGLVGLYALD